MLKCATSLWSADLSHLAAAIQWAEPYSERFHLDVADGHYTPTLLFFPDLVKASPPAYAVAIRSAPDDHGSGDVDRTVCGCRR